MRQALLGVSGDGRVGNGPAVFSYMDSALQNLDFLRQLIAESRQEQPYDDMEILRMLYGTGMGTDRREDA